jgi:signal transduction histidine kinase
VKIGPRITIATTALVTVTLGVYAVFDLRSAASQRRASTEQYAREVALSIRASLESTNLARTLNNAQSVAANISRAADPWRVAIVPIAELEAAAPDDPSPPLKRLRRIVDAPDFPLKVEEDDAFTYVLPLRLPPKLPDTGPRTAGSLEVSLSIAHLRDQFRSDLIRTLLIILLTVAMTVLAVAGLTRSLMTRPVEKLLAGIDDVAHGDLSHVLLYEREDEIGALAARFNEMTYSLRESRAETERQNETKLQLEQRLGQTEKLATIGQLAAEIAHEVGTPLGVIAGRARTLLRKAKDPEAVHKNATIISEQTARITRIIQRLLDFTRRKVGTSEPAQVNLNELALTTMELLEGKLTSAGVKHRLLRAQGLPLIKGDPDRLQQVLLNLVLNAIQAMPEGGTLTVETSAVIRRRPGLEVAPEQEYVVIAVTDSGMGIPMEKREKIFEPFYTSKYDDGGTGLGLAVCYGIVKEHDGWIEISDGATAGTVFAVHLPTGD